LKIVVQTKILKIPTQNKKKRTNSRKKGVRAISKRLVVQINIHGEKARNIRHTGQAITNLRLVDTKTHV